MEDVTATLSTGVVERDVGGGQFEVRLEEGVRTCHIGPMLRRVGVTIGERARVTVRTEADGVFRGEITQVRPPLDMFPRPVPERHASLVSRAAPTLLPRDQKIDRSLHPGWMTGAERLPRAGDAVYCTGGVATVLRVLGRTGNGSRLLELSLPGAPRASFFAAASNVLVQPAADGAVIRAGVGGS